jgi:alkylation response protein AidB-like acyl-CoA dehydrogenase
MTDVFAHLLSAPAPASPLANVEEYFARADIAIAGARGTVDRAARAGFCADRLGYAFAGGYVAALARLDRGLFGRAALCVTEEGGGHPRAVRTRLEAHGDGYRLNGHKTFVTLARSADQLLVAASVGQEGERNLIRVARVPPARAGILLSDVPTTPFAPEIPHAAVTFADVAVAPEELLEGDGYTDFVKPFRTIEDVHVLAATLGYLVQAARAYAWPRGRVEGLLADLAALVTIGACDPRDRAVHVALGGALARVRAHVAELDPSWRSAPEDARERWGRDAPLLTVADRVRAARLEAAWRSR